MRSSAGLVSLLLLIGCGARSALETPPPCATASDCGETSEDVCAPRTGCVDGACVAIPPLSCDDGLDCTLDRCDSRLAACVNMPVDADDDTHVPLECGGLDCDDGDPSVHPGVAERCEGGVDEDCDGRTDCSDPDCFGAPVCDMCEPERCSGGVDDDCDGLVDCEDSDCMGSPECCFFAETFCDDGRDDDCDGLVDCEDVDCTGQPGCCTPGPETCNGEDDDCDGVADDGIACFTIDGSPLAAVETSACGDVFYAYDMPDAASANPIPDVRSADEAVVFVHHSTDGCGSSVTIIADLPRDMSGGELEGEYRISPARIANLYVADEPGECTLDASGAGRCQWVWQPCCTDGVMIGPFNEDFCVELSVSSPVGVRRLYVLDGADERDVPFGASIQICGSYVPEV
ncbi:MAG: MopE-related protein [Sandaracinaceae bacterium]